MNKFIKELRRREVFRTAGLYVGICWILIEVASVVLPAFGAPEWLFQGAIVAVIAGFPVMLVLAWFLDVNKEGISLQADPTDTVVEHFGGRKTDFAVIGVLVLALIVSLFLNLSDEAPVKVETEPVSVLVSQFANATNDPQFDHVLEEAMIVGLEVAPNITIFDGREAQSQSGVDFLVAGSVESSGSAYRVSVEVTDAANGQSAFETDEETDSHDAVLQAIEKLSAESRKRLGGTTSDNRNDGQAQTLLAGSLEAAHAYALARQFETAGRFEDAVEHYRLASISDPNLGRAFSGLALAEFTLGRTVEAAEHWTTAQSLMDTMTGREQLRAMGRYALFVANDADAAAEIYAEFVDRYPADIDAHDSYASVLFQQLNFSRAVDEMRNVVNVTPANPAYRAKLAFYSIYTGDWEAAASEAEQAVAADPEIGAAYLPIATAALAQNKPDAARDAYRRLSVIDKVESGASVANLGMADIDLYFGQADSAQERLIAGINADINSGDYRFAALKYVALAQSYAEQGNFVAAATAATEAVSFSSGVEVKVPAAMIYLQAGDPGSTNVIIDELGEQADAHSRAYAQMLHGMVLESEGAQTDAILAMRNAIATADLWLIRYQTGKAYLRADSFPEALDEFTVLNARRGEAASAYLDQMPTFRLLAELPYWTGRSQEALGMGEAARASYAEYLELRPDGGPLTDDASDRAATLD